MKNVHPNSLKAITEELYILTKRALFILDEIETGGPGTDRELMHRLRFQEPNAVRPRITELIDAGRLSEIGSMRDALTKKSVRVVGLPITFNNSLFEAGISL